MGRRKKGDVPALRHHLGLERGRVRFDGYTDTWIEGHWPRSQKVPPAEVQRAYEEALTMWLRRRSEQSEKRPTGPYPFVAELFAAYVEHCRLYYRKNGRETSEVGVIIRACRIVAQQFGEEYVHQFGVGKLKVVRAEMLRLGWARKSINKQIQRVIAMFRWGNEQQLKLTDVLADLRTLAPLKYGRTTARETKRIRPADMTDVRKTLAHMRDPFPDMVEVHFLLGCRAAEIVCMRAREIKHDERGWRFEPESWKVEHHEQDPVVHWIGPKCLEILKRRMKGKGPDDYLFPSFRNRSGRQREGANRTCYTTQSYRRAVARTCTEKKITRWSPLQIRKARATAIEVAFDLEHARVSICHRKISTTQLYAAANQAKAQAVAAAMG